MTKNIIVVGNKPCTGKETINGVNIKEYIDSFDLVFRVNKFDYYPLNGTRLDGAWLEINDDFFNQQNIINFKNRVGDSCLKYVYIPSNWRHHIYNLSQNVNYKELSIIDSNYMKSINCDFKCVSTIRLVYVLLNDERFKNYNINLICFDQDRNNVPDKEQYLGYHNKKVCQKYLNDLFLNNRFKFINYELN